MQFLFNLVNIIFIDKGVGVRTTEYWLFFDYFWKHYNQTITALLSDSSLEQLIKIFISVVSSISWWMSCFLKNVPNCALLHIFLFRTYIILCDPRFPCFPQKIHIHLFLDIFLNWIHIVISNRDLNAACRNSVLAIVPDLTAWLIVVGSVIEGEDFFGSVGRLLFHTRAACAYRPLKLHCCKEEKKLTNNRYAIRFISIWFCLQGHRRWPLHCNLHCPILQKLHHVSHPCLEVQ